MAMHLFCVAVVGICSSDSIKFKLGTGIESPRGLWRSLLPYIWCKVNARRDGGWNPPEGMMYVLCFFSADGRRYGV
jgi:hypothetical protein